MKIYQAYLPFEYQGNMCFVFPTKKELDTEVKRMLSETLKEDPDSLKHCVAGGKIEVDVWKYDVIKLNTAGVCEIINSHGSRFASSCEELSPLIIPVELPEE